jgi:hypothetical protein
MVIRERVRLIEGELTVESSPSRRLRLEVTVPTAKIASASFVHARFHRLSPNARPSLPS